MTLELNDQEFEDLKKALGGIRVAWDIVVAMPLEGGIAPEFAVRAAQRMGRIARLLERLDSLTP